MHQLIVVGNGMVGHKVIDLLAGSDRPEARAFEITTFCEEPRLAYDRVHLTSFFEGRTAAELSLVEPGAYDRAGVTAHVGERAVSIDRAAKTVTSSSGRVLRYDKLVLATGSAPFVPPVPGRNRPGCFVYRTIEDLEGIAAYAGKAGVKVGAVIGGGLLGLEAANALKQLGLETHVVELAPRLMAVQLDDAAGAVLRARIEALGVQVHSGS
jgi:nitrite reductase (NADH) large subunit